MHASSSNFSYAPASSAGATLTLIALGLAIRLAGGLLIPELIVYDDERGYDGYANSVSRHISFGLSNPFPLYGWHTVTGILYYVFFADPVVLKIFNSILGVASAFLISGAVRRIYEDETIARTVLYVSLFLPPVVFLSTIILKEQFAAFSLCLFVYGFARGDHRGLIIAAIGCALILWIRNSYVFVMLTAVAMAWAIATLLSWRMPIWLRVGVFAGLIAGAVSGALILRETSFFQSTKVGSVIGGTDERGYQTLSGSDMVVLRYLDRGSIFSPKNIVVPPLRGLYTPSPLRGIKVPEYHVVFVEGFIRAAFWYAAIPFAVIALFRSTSFRHMVFFGTAVGVFVAASYTVLTGFPETERYRWPMLPLLFALASIGWHTEAPRMLRRAVHWGWWSSAVLFSFIYLAS